MVALIPDEECLILLNKKYFLEVNKVAGYLSGPVMPTTADGAPFECQSTPLWSNKRALDSSDDRKNKKISPS